MKRINGYFNSLKSIEVEEILDLIIFRPLAYLLVKVLIRFNITPNQISISAIIPGIMSGLFISTGTDKGFVAGAIFMILSGILDCADGMVARMKQNGSKTGRLVDGAVDYIVSAAIYIGLVFGLLKSSVSLQFPILYSPVLIVIVAALSHSIHAALTDRFRNLYEAHVYGKNITPEYEFSEYSRELEKIRFEKGKALDRLLIRGYLKYISLQTKLPENKFIRLDPDLYMKYNKNLVISWNLIGTTTHLSILIISLILYKPVIYFYYCLIFANLWILVLIPFQLRAMKMTSDKAFRTDTDYLRPGMA
ncbi:MAG: hypothetical protein GQ565_10020 [Candidatus Aegiribacteria sp.]|nr:hypothetical protein [Candidatus Aegiribacteria sp.]